MISDVVVRVAFGDVLSFVNSNNQLAQDEDKDYTRAVLKLLHRGGHQLVPDELRDWALSNDWGEVAAKRLKHFTERVLEGGRFVYKSRLNRGLTDKTLAYWRDKAAKLDDS